MACYAQDDALAAHARFQDAYASQDYSEEAGPRDVATGCRQILDALLGDNGVRSIINHPVIRYHVIVARCLGLAGVENKAFQSLGMLLAMCEQLREAFSHIHAKQNWASIAEPLPW